MYKIKIKKTFDSAHFLEGYSGKCKNVHGHTYKLICIFCAQKLIDTGEERDMLADFNTLKPHINEIVDSLDHALLVEDTKKARELEKSLNGDKIVFFEHRPTAERIAEYIFVKLKQKKLPISEVEIYETENSSAIYCE